MNQEPFDQTGGSANGAAVAAFLSAGIGAFTLGLIVILNEAGWLVVPGWYPPAGGVSGRTTLAVVLWLIAWAVLHRRWRRRQLESRRIHAAALILIGLGVLLAFPPVWKLL